MEHWYKNETKFNLSTLKLTFPRKTGLPKIIHFFPYHAPSLGLSTGKHENEATDVKNILAGTLVAENTKKED